MAVRNTEKRKLTPRQIKRFLQKSLVWLKYCSPALLLVLTLIFCAIPAIRFRNGDELLSLQSVAGLVKSSAKGIEATKKENMDEYTTMLVKNMEPTITVYYIVMWAFALIAIYILIFSCCTLYRDQTDPDTNRIKLWFGTFLPGRGVMLISMLLPLYPAAVPHIIRYLYFKYYVYNDLEVVTNVFDPTVAVAVAVAVAVVVFFAAIPFERRFKMDMFRRYEDG